MQGALGLVRQLSGRERISPTLDEILALLGQAPGEGAAGAAEEFVSEVAGECEPWSCWGALHQVCVLPLLVGWGAILRLAACEGQSCDAESFELPQNSAEL